MLKKLIYKPTQNRKTQEIIYNILDNIGRCINIIFTDNLCMLGSQTSDRIIKEIEGVRLYKTDDNKTISVHCESEDVEGVSRKQIATHIYGLITAEGVRNIITLTNSVRLPQIRDIIQLLIARDSLGRAPIIPSEALPSMNLYFDEADKTINSITRELNTLLDKLFINDFYITATPKKVLKLYGEMSLYPVKNILDKYINLQYANWIDIGTHEYLDALREMFTHIRLNDKGHISSKRFIFAPGIILKDSHYQIAEESTNVYGCISIVVNSDGLIILLPGNILEKYLDTCVDSHNIKIPLLPDNLKESFNRRDWNKVSQVEGGVRFYKLTFNKKSLIIQNENEFWKIMETVRTFWKDNPLLVTGSRCIERGITVQNPFNEAVRFTDGMLHCNISRSDSGSQMAGRFTLTYNDTLTRKDFKPINIYSDERTKMYMINQEKKAMYAVELSSSGKDKINYDEWKGYERTSILGEKEFTYFVDALEYATETFVNGVGNYNRNSDYSETKSKLGSCTMIDNEDSPYNGFRYNSFDSSDKVPIDKKMFLKRRIRHLCWREGKTGNYYRIWAVYDDLSKKESLKYHLCWTPLAINREMNESDSDSDL